jgi:beta-lactam-binding protein with PASTA domain
MKRFWSWLKKHTIAYNVVVIALVFLGLAIASFIAMALGTRHSARRTVPDFVGLNLNDAEFFAGRRNLEIIVNDSLHVSSYPGGVILDQLPKGGVVVKPGRKIYVTINSMRQRMVTVPYVAGRSLRQAKNMLETAGLTIDYLEYVEDIATNYVLAEFVNGEEVLEDSELKIEKGSGVVLRVGVAPNDVTAVPQVLGRSLFEAKSRLWESGLNIGEIEFDEGMPVLERNRAKVYRQSMMPSAETAYGSRVSLRLTLDAALVDSMIVAEERRVEAELKAKMEADSIAKAEQRLLDSIANAQKAQLQSAPQTEDNFFF